MQELSGYEEFSKWETLGVIRCGPATGDGVNLEAKLIDHTGIIRQPAHIVDEMWI